MITNRLIPNLLKIAALACCVIISVSEAQAQAELMPYGNLNGIRIKGQLIDFNTSIAVVGNSWHKINSTGKERQKPKFKRTGDIQVVNTAIDSMLFTETVEDLSQGKIKVNISCEIRKDTSIKGVYFDLKLPKSIFDKSSVSIKKIADNQQTAKDGFPVTYAQGISFKTDDNQFAINTPEPISILRPSADTLNYIQLYFPICEGSLKKGEVFQRMFEIKVSGKIDHTDATMQLDTTITGREFAGLGGNFRLQNPRTDPQVIDYCLKN